MFDKRGSFEEAIETPADFPKDGPVAFGDLVCWVYFGSLPELADHFNGKKAHCCPEPDL